MTPRILIIAGSDSGGGAGIQADIKTVTMLGGHAMTAITAITAQNTLGVQAVLPVPTDMVIAQINSVVTDIGVDAVKIGMIGSAETAYAVAEVLTGLSVPIVFDPVMVATSGDMLADEDTIAAFERLMRLATVTTPNLPELKALVDHAGIKVTEEDIEVYPHEAPSMRPWYQAMGVKLARRLDCTLLVKGGHGVGMEAIDWRIEPDGAIAEWGAPRLYGVGTHGTGCTLASAIATYLGNGVALDDAIVRARQFVRLAMLRAPGLGQGIGPLGQQDVRLDLGPDMRLNQITLPADQVAAAAHFYTTLGLTQIVATDDDHYARFEAPGGMTLSLEHGARPTIFLECDDLDGAIVRLQAAGIDFDSMPEDQRWLWREARLTDPAGNAVCLFRANTARRYPPWRLTDA